MHKRLDLIDILRGVALFGILVVNVPFFAQPIYTALEADSSISFVDQAVAWIVSFAFEAKFYVLFSFLFGYGLAVQLLRAEAKNEPLGPRYARRLIGLLVFGLLHAVFFFVGDILVSYVLLGVLLWLWRDWPVRRLVMLAGWLMGLAVLGRVLLAQAELFDPTSTTELMQLSDTARQLYLGNFFDNAQQRIQDLAVFYIFTPLFNWPTALAMFALGLAAGKVGVFAQPDRYWPAAFRLLPWALIVGVSGNLLYATFGFTTLPPFAAVVLSMIEALAAPALSYCYLVGVWWVVQRAPHARWLEPIRAAGRMSLTNYLGQAIICSALFNGWGLGLYGQIGPLGCLLLALLIYSGQILVSRWWLQRFRSGPDEWLLRSWVYLRWQPWRAAR
jgi:uncharacterized protein